MPRLYPDAGYDGDCAVCRTARQNYGRRHLALTAGILGRTASMYNLLSRGDVFGLSRGSAQHEVASMLQVVKGWREFYAARGVAEESMDMLVQAMLPASFFLDTPNEPLF